MQSQMDKLRGVLGGMIGKGMPMSKKKSTKMKLKPKAPASLMKKY